MIHYFKMKRKEFKVKAMLYETISRAIDSRKEVIELLGRLYTALKNVPVEKLREEFITKLAEIVHEENNPKD